MNQIDQNKNWPTWSVPTGMLPDYFFKLIFVFWFIPALFGMMFTPLGFFLNFLIVDYIIYIGYKMKGKL